ncbi:MAG TPA: hypothetical protein VMF11_06235 [Candidatus Baltobacteraceae bacterium]|nr:hypothetical protein [Candidatus Baltobacteraceae bacterium]
MITKRIAALAALSAIISMAAPAMAAAPTITVKWNTQTISTFVVTTQASAAETHSGTAENIYWGGNGSTSSGCAGTTDTASAGTDNSANGTVNFGSVTPDAADYTDCLEVNAVNAYVATNDSNGYNVTVQATSAVPSNYAAAANGAYLCLLPNGTWANNLAYTASTRNAAVAITSTTACPAGDFGVASSAATTLLAETASTAATNIPQDMELVLGPNASSTGQVAMVVTYTLTTL